MEVEEIQKELEHGLNKVKGMLADAQVAMGIIEAMLYMIRKDSEKKIDSKEP